MLRTKKQLAIMYIKSNTFEQVQYGKDRFDSHPHQP